MLTADLLLTARRGESVRPRLLDVDDAAALEAAAELLALAEVHVGQTRGELEAALAQVRVPALREQVVRGLAELVLQRGDFAGAAGDDPAALRGALFEAGAQAWRAHAGDAPGDWQAGVVADVAAARGLTPEAVQAQLFADLRENHRLQALEPLAPRELLWRYNVAQCQGLLLSAERVELVSPWPSPQRLRQLLRYLKFFGLLFQPQEDPAALRLTVDGPLSVLEGTQRYGLNLAQFFPALLLWEEPWRLRATLHLRGTSRQWRGQGLQVLELAPGPLLRSHYRDQGQWVPPDVARFLEGWPEAAARHGEWSAAPAEALLKLPGNRFLIPDFVLTHGPSGRRLYLEHLPQPSRERVLARGRLIALHGAGDYLLACRALPALKALAAAQPWLATYQRTFLPSAVLRHLRDLPPQGALPVGDLDDLSATGDSRLDGNGDSKD
ncbi:MAG: DUF790 family protein [Candidatus Lambdaproteobacteria bacterium]|nr:DUF790 family protein [Candidatus Lambdaproteobacteria bacterium]